MAHPKAVLFTHINVKATALLDPAGFDAFYKERGSFFESCLACNNVAIIFVYVSYGIEEYVRAAGHAVGSSVVFPFNVIESEERIFNALQMSVDKALDNLQTARGKRLPPSGTPQFVFVGVRELASLLKKLSQRNPQLVEYLAGQGSFTYDSPKFVEAAIRLVRGRTDDAKHPIIRIDADVEPNQDGIREIIERAELLRRQERMHPYWWFSGSYSGNFPNDPVNAHAVRQAWLIDPNTWADPGAFALLPRAETFLRDLAEFGATQVDSSAECSTACNSLIERRGKSLSRPVPQVISGAGLVTSVAAIRRLPPFMNSKDMIVWIDDHLKRQLHEAIGDFSADAPERLGTATLKQNRHPRGIEQGDVDWARSTYFQRLLNGCLMHAAIKVGGTPGPLARWVKDVTLGVRNDLSTSDEATLNDELKAVAEIRYDEVQEVWCNADYGNDILKDWASALTPSHKELICKKVAEVGASYVKLVLVWNQHLWAIDTLGSLEAYWLFTRVRF